MSISQESPIPSLEQAASSDAVQDSSTAKHATARRMKKRELDRRCQQKARERTKARMEYLEKLVEDFRRQDASGHVTGLMGQLSDLRKERDNFARTLNRVAKLTKNYQDLENNTSQSPSGVEGHNFSRQNVQTSNVPVNSGAPGFSFTASSPAQSDFILDVSGQKHYHGDTAIQDSQDSRLNSNLQNQSACLDFDIFEINSSSSAHTGIFNNANSSEALIDNCHAWDSIIPRTGEACDCDTMTHPSTPYTPKNLWRFANDTLTMTTISSLRAVISREEESMSENIPIRALLEGWGAVEHLLEHYPSWQALRQIDEELFSSCEKVERLAILRVMHLLLQYHAVPTHERYAKLPSWYTKRPSQSFLAHSYAIDFFAWPGLRERFVFSQHRYCSNLFWELFSSSFRLLWPFEFRDSYSFNTQTGLYHVSTMFDERIRDIQCWTMGPEMFKRFPEFYSDIATIDHIPHGISTHLPLWIEAPRSDNNTDGRVVDEDYILPPRNG